MEIQLWQSILLGFVQGITEFVPVSSSGHLMLMSYMFKFPTPSLSFEVALHLGTLGAVVIYFWRDWMNIFGLKKDIEVYQQNKNLFWYLVLASIPVAIVGFSLKDVIEEMEKNSNPVMVAMMILIGATFLFLADRYSSTKKSLANITIKESLIIGFFQILALTGGISRSGMTISSARLLKINRVDSARFSFLLGTPVIFGAGFLHLLDFQKENFNSDLLIGMIISFIVGVLTIHFFLNLMKKISYAVFFWYSLGLMLLVLFCRACYIGRF